MRNRLAALFAPVLAIAMVGASLGTAGCAGEPDLLNSLLIQPQTADELGYGIQWQTALGLRPGERLIYVESLGDRLVTLDTANALTVFDAANGSRMWSHQLGKPNERFSRPVRRGDELVICSETRIYIYDLEFGDLVKGLDLLRGSSTTPVIYGDELVHGSPGGFVWSQETQFGVSRWAYGTGSGITNNPILVDQTVVVTNAAGQVHAIDAANGLLLWDRATYTQVSSKPATDGRMLFVASEDQSVYAYFLSTGRQAWRHYGEDPIRGDLTLMGGVLMVHELGRRVLALNPANGEVMWTNNELASMQRPLLANERGIYLKMPYSIDIINPRTGQVIQSTPTDAVHDVAVGGAGTRPDLYLIRGNGRIMKLVAR